MNIYKILFVDDELNILQSLKRAFFNYPEFEVYTALSAEEGAGILATQRIDVLVSDEKMPKIEGSQFVQYVKERFPDVTRCILTGYADMEHILKAVNKGEVYRYLVKPWNDEDLITTVRAAAQYGRLKQYNRELERQLKAQNESLKKEVTRRTAYLEKALKSAKFARETMTNNFDGIVAIISHLLGIVDPMLKENSSRTARLCERLAVTMELSSEEIRNIRTAALLKDIGKVEKGTAKSKTESDYAESGARLLESISTLGPIALLIKHQNERFDGKGTPGNLVGEEIPLGSRIIKTAADYVRLLYEENLSYEAALEQTVKGTNALYDPHIIQVLRRLERTVSGKKSADIPIQIKNLGPGMVLKNDLLSKNGVLILPKNTALTEAMVEHLTKNRLLDPEETVYLQTVKVSE